MSLSNFSLVKHSPKAMNNAAMALLCLLLNISANANQHSQQPIEASTSGQLSTIYVSDSSDKEQAGKDGVFLKDNVTEYKSKKEIETFHSQSVADLVSGVTGVYSGDARNGGAIDPIIRSTWGQGRIPVLVDDTEQAITIWRGYAGVNNRNYLDPFLISEVEVEKGPNLDRSLRTGAGGTVRMKTLSVNDIIPAGQNWGVELKTETATNSVKRRPYQGAPIGQDYRLVAADGSAELGDWGLYLKDDETIKPRKKGRNKLARDNAARLAVAAKGEKYELLAAYAYRDKGNYFSGKRGGHNYGQNLTARPNYEQMKSDDPYIPNIAKIYLPGEEVPNTAYHSRSWLLKGKYHFSDSLNISTNLRHSDIDYGDIMPSRLGKMLLRDDGVVREWPQAKVKQTAASVDLAYNPEDNQWIDLKLGLWSVWNRTQTNTSGGSPSDVIYYDKLFAAARGEAFNNVGLSENIEDLENEILNFSPEKRKEYQNRVVEEARRIGREMVKNGTGSPNINGLLNTQPAQVQFARDKHQGITFSNRFALHPKLNLDIMANYRRETLNSTNVYDLFHQYGTTGEISCLDSEKYGEAAGNICRQDNDTKSGNRKGKRNEFTAGFKFEYMPTDWLMLTAGAKYVHYKSKDLGLQALLQKVEREKMTYPARIAFNYGKLNSSTEQERRNADNYDRKNSRLTELTTQFSESTPMPYAYDEKYGESEDPFSNPNYLADQAEWEAQLDAYLLAHGAESPTQAEIDDNYKLNSMGVTTPMETIYWERDEYGRFPAETFPLYDGRIPRDLFSAKGIHPKTGEETSLYTLSTTELNSPEKIPVTVQQWEAMKKAERKGHAWSPSFGATLFFSPNARLYVRYDETKRMPSIFEDTIGYSIDILTPLYKRKPEHSKNLEIGYVHDLRGFWPNLERADFRLNWYRNTTRNIFDRDYTYEMKQFDKRILEGLELQARLDQGSVFADLGISYTLKNKFCDRSSAIIDVGSITSSFEPYPTCVNGGNENGYLKNTILPKYSITSNLGVRLLARKLEIGTRLVYHTNVKETRNKSLRDAGFGNGLTNAPRWQPVLLVDAYLNYRIRPNWLLSLSVTNLTDRYYLDAMTKSSMPAPGRTVKLGLTATF